MGIFGNIFGTTKSEVSGFDWIPLIHASQLEEIDTHSHKKAQIIFKHSTRCIISRTALKNFEATHDQNLKFDLFYLDLLNHRAISDEIVERFGITHESPQLLVIKNGKCIYSETHEHIDAALLETYQ